MSLAHDAIIGASRRLRFQGKGRLLDLIGLGPSNRDLVPPGVSEVECVEGIRMQSSCPSDAMFRALYLHGSYQDDVLCALRALLSPGRVLWDVGANYGLMSIYVDRVFAGAVTTIAFEPSPIVLPELRRNLALNGCKSVRVEPICLSDRVGKVRFFTSSDHSWNATLIESFARAAGEDVEIEVDSSTIDECVERLPAPDVIKVDVEGAEHLVVSGGRRFLKSAATSIVAEYNVQALEEAGLDGRRYLDLYRELGYEVHYLKRPLWGRYRWDHLVAVRDERQLPTLCNVVLLKPTRDSIGG